MRVNGVCHLAGCKQPVPPQKPGKRPSLYCCEAHRKLTSRRRKAMAQHAKVRQNWDILPIESQQHLDVLLVRYGPEAAALALAAIKASYRDSGSVICLYRWFSRPPDPA